MTREELISAPEYWVANFQNDLYEIVSLHMKDKNMDFDAAVKYFEISKRALRRILNGDANESILTVCSIVLKCGYVPNFKTNVMLTKFIENDKRFKK